MDVKYPLFVAREVANDAPKLNYMLLTGFVLKMVCQFVEGKRVYKDIFNWILFSPCIWVLHTWRTIYCIYAKTKYLQIHWCWKCSLKLFKLVSLPTAPNIPQSFFKDLLYFIHSYFVPNIREFLQNICWFTLSSSQSAQASKCFCKHFQSLIE